MTYAVGAYVLLVALHTFVRKYNSNHPETHRKWLEIGISNQKYRLAAPAASKKGLLGKNKILKGYFGRAKKIGTYAVLKSRYTHCPGSGVLL